MTLVDRLYSSNASAVYLQEDLSETKQLLRQLGKQLKDLVSRSSPQAAERQHGKSANCHMGTSLPPTPQWPLWAEDLAYTSTCPLPSISHSEKASICSSLTFRDDACQSPQHKELDVPNQKECSETTATGSEATHSALKAHSDTLQLSRQGCVPRSTRQEDGMMAHSEGQAVYEMLVGQPVDLENISEAQQHGGADFALQTAVLYDQVGPRRNQTGRQ